MSDSTDPLDVLARTLWGEARGDGEAGMTAVGAVILNRAANPRWWGDNVRSVCLEPWQFSCRNRGDPNLPKLQAVTSADAAFRVALAVAANAIGGTLADPTAGADSYFASAATPPIWASRAKFTRRILRHSFYRLELPAPSGLPEAPNIRALDADDLNQAELDGLPGGNGAR